MSQALPRVRLTLDHMREEIVHAFNARAGDLSDMIALELDRALSDDAIHRLIADEVANSMREHVRSTVKGAFLGLRLDDRAMDSVRREIAKCFGGG